MTTESTNPVILLQQVHRWRMAFFGLAILVAGIAIGAGSTLIWTGHRKPIRPPASFIQTKGQPGPLLVEGLRRSLQLSQDQVRQIDPIVHEHMGNLIRIREEAHPKIVEQLRLMNKRILDVLNEKQKDLWRYHFKRLQDQFQFSPEVPRRFPVGPTETQNPRRKGQVPEARPGRPAKEATPAPEGTGD